jgi:hypothetical protein
MRIRRKVLNMTYSQWTKLDEYFNLKNEKSDDATFETTPSEFLEKIGLPGSLSTYCNDIETEFFKQIYELYRNKAR